MIRILRLDDALQNKQARQLRAQAGEAPTEVVRQIIAGVRARGDEAVRELTERFDGADLSDPFLDEARWDELAAQCSQQIREALLMAHQRVRAFHAPQIPASYELQLRDGGVLRSTVLPLARAACYVPGGRAVYPSTVLMTAGVARLAGVHQVIIATPPRRDGSIAPEVAAAARIAGADRIFLCGGAQAVAALAIGTPLVPRVDVIVGPGNAYVTEAKRQLSGEVRIDSLAGPTEVAIVADGSADPRFVAADLIAQAEHDPLALAILVTHDGELAEKVRRAIDAQLLATPNAIAAESLRARGAAVVTESLDAALAFADDFAPEHLQLMLEDAAAAVAKVPRAAAVFVGHHSPTPVGDYLAGPNHTLPTSGTARFASSLGSADFVRRQNVIQYGEQQLAQDTDALAALAHAEGLHGHAYTVEVRRRKP
ncbi:MAG TPA: histidinol dehydrogenase [Myxococcales bacterium]|jgi:histidinol dehydrogenase|nr:histidinol dehydrogenase [Myxococcales bacterium]